MLSKAKVRANADRQEEYKKGQSFSSSVSSSQQAMREEDQFRLIQTRAYFLWENAGKPEGEEYKERFWSEAEKQISLRR